MSQLFIMAFRTGVLGFIAQQAEASQMKFPLFDECLRNILLHIGYVLLRTAAFLGVVS
jgi:hypothetical protein